MTIRGGWMGLYGGKTMQGGGFDRRNTLGFVTVLFLICVRLVFSAILSLPTGMCQTKTSAGGRGWEEEPPLTILLRPKGAIRAFFVGTYPSKGDC